MFDENTKEYFDERAAIAEFDAGMQQHVAEHFAWQLTLKRYPDLTNSRLTYENYYQKP